MLKYYFYVFLVTGISLPGLSQSNDGVGIGTTSVNEDAILQIDSDGKGVLVPRMTTGDRNDMNPVSEGLMVYDMSVDAFYYYDGSSWIRLIASPAKANVNLGSHKITGLSNGTNSGDAVNKGQLDTKLNLSGGALTGSLTMSSNKIQELADGTNNSDAVNYSQLNTRVAKSGDIMTGSLEIQEGFRTNSSTGYLEINTFDIGDWNMDSDTYKGVNIFIDPLKIRSVSVIIQNDNGSSVKDLLMGGSWYTGNVVINNILLVRQAAGEFDNTNYDATSFNRGWITIMYEK